MNKKLALFIFVDALGWEELKRYPIMVKEAPYRKPLKTIFGYSSACDPSILSGLYPKDHLHWSSFFYSPKTSPFKALKYLSILPKFLANRARVRHQISKLLKKYYGFTGYFEIYNVPFNLLSYFDYAEKKDLYIKNGLIKGETIFDVMIEKKYPYYVSNWRLGETDNFKNIRSALETGKPKFAYLFLGELDALMHRIGNEHEEVKLKVKSYETRINGLLDFAHKHYENINFYIFSDHGMANITDTVDLISAVTSTNLKFGKDYVAMYDSTMGRFWFLNQQAKDKIHKVLNNFPGGKILNDDVLKSYGTFFPDYMYGDTIFLVEPGVQIVPSFMGEKRIAGMHGYDPEDKDSNAAIMSNNILGDNIIGLTDIHSLMLKEISQE